MSLKVSYRIPHKEHEMFTARAAESVIGNQLDFNGKPAVVTGAYVDEGDLIVALEIEGIDGVTEAVSIGE